MITPEPVLMTNENGRLFEFEMGRMEKLRKEVMNEEGQLVEEFEEKWVQYKFNQKKDPIVR